MQDWRGERMQENRRGKSSAAKIKKILLNTGVDKFKFLFLGIRKYKKLSIFTQWPFSPDVTLRVGNVNLLCFRL